MTGGNFDHDMNWNDQEHPEALNPDDGFEMLPPDLVQGEIENVKQAEEDLFWGHPGEAVREKPTDPDAWHH
jgi:hypothetical protein